MTETQADRVRGRHLRSSQARLRVLEPKQTPWGGSGEVDVREGVPLYCRGDSDVYYLRVSHRLV